MTTAASRRWTTVAGLETNTLVDGFFHLAAWVVGAGGRARPSGRGSCRELAPPWRTHIGLLLAGWGAFNVVEGLIDHQLLGIHHVRDDLGAAARLGPRLPRLGALLVAGGFSRSAAGQVHVRDAAAGVDGGGDELERRRGRPT